MVRTTLGAEVETTVTVSGSESVDYLDARRSSTVSANSAELITVRPPAGFVYELITIKLDIRGISGEGSAQHQVGLQSETLGITTLFGRSSGDDRLRYQTSHWANASQSKQPPDVAAAVTAVKGLRADDSNGFQIRYQNQTASDQTGDRIYQLWVRQIEVGE